jgi:lipoic acid synthetase
MEKRLPPWLRSRYSRSSEIHQVKSHLRKRGLHTVCESAMCPNIFECFSKPTATFMIMGDVCTRNCGFCAVAGGMPESLDPHEPVKIAQTARELALKHVVVTSVTRDDLPDGGALHFAATVRAIRDQAPQATVEVLTPDFGGDAEAIETVVRSGPHVFNHNLETVPRLYGRVRPQARYRCSLEVLRYAKELDGGLLTKSGLMVGLGEEESEVFQVMRDLREVGCDMLTIGQYLRPSREHLPVVEYIHPDRFERYGEMGEKLGFLHVASAPLVRSSFNAEEALERNPG